MLTKYMYINFPGKLTPSNRFRPTPPVKPEEIAWRFPDRATNDVPVVITRCSENYG